MGIRYITVNGQTDITRGLEATQVFSFFLPYYNFYVIVKVSTPR
jgi:hypothetical protein